jgi:hypothetical protein
MRPDQNKFRLASCSERNPLHTADDPLTRTLPRGGILLIEAKFSQELDASIIQKVGDQASSSTGPWIAFVGTLLAAVIAGLFALGQWRKNHKLETEKLEWEREKLFRTWARDEALEERTQHIHEQRIQATHDEDSAKTHAQREHAATSLAQYCTRLSRELRIVKILDMSRPIDLLKLYVTLQISEHAERYISDDRIVKGPSVVEEDARIYSINHTFTNSTYTPEEAFRKYDRLVILGDPGAGKTTMLRKLALEMSERRYQTKDKVQIPLYVELRTLLDADGDSIVDILIDEWSKQFTLNIPREELIHKLESGEAAFLFDGLDEVRGGADVERADRAYIRSTSMIKQISRSYPECPIVVTCRKHGWKGGLPVFQTVEVLDFNWNQIEKFIVAWFDHDPSKGRRLVRTLSVNMRLKSLAANRL